MDNKIIAAAREAGMTTGENQKHNGEYWWRSLGRQTNVSTSDLERFYAIAYRQGLEDAATKCGEVYHRNIGPAHGEVRYGIAQCATAIRELMKEQNHG